MKWLALFFALLAAACPSQPPSGRCETTSDCPPDQQCAAGVCVAGPIPCGSTQPCPSDQACCGGVCAPTHCCLADLDCADGYCHLGTCRPGPRPACSQVASCPGRCLLTLDQCVECIYSDDCANPELVCNEDHRCVPPGTPCTVASCAAQDLICSPQGDCRACTSTPECGSEVCNTGLCVPCSTDPQCGLGRVCAAGACVNDPNTPCTTNADCGAQVCNPTSWRCEPCTTSPPCGSGRACNAGLCVALTPNCVSDAQCSPPATICQAGLCVPGCTPMSCASGQLCSTTTGRCAVSSTGTLALGAACTAHSQCTSGVCWPVLDAASGQVALLCSQACMTTAHCPTDFVCVELGDGNLCVDKARFGVPADVLPGGSCSTDFVNVNCKSGYCDRTRGECMEMCGRNSDCAGLDPDFICTSRWPVGEDADQNGFLSVDEIDLFTQLCHEPFGSLEVDAVCAGPAPHETCKTGFCMQTPDYTIEARCARPCCTPADCQPGRSVCKPIHAWDGIAPPDASEPYTFLKACLWREYGGALAIGQLCTADSDCKSEMCIAGPAGNKRCTHTCCNKEDCADYDWAESCRPAFAGTTPVSDPNVADVRRSLGRIAWPFAAIAEAYTTVCMPR